MDENIYHIPVLLKESIDLLVTDTAGVYVDLTLGGAGHCKEILSRLDDEAKVIVFDQDAAAGSNLPDDHRIIYCNANFRFLSRFLKMHGVEKVNGILGDLGISSHQLNSASYGIAMRIEGPLDMRMSDQTSLTADKILNTYPEDKLANVLFQYGELRSSRRLASAIVTSRKDRPLRTTSDLLAVAETVLKGKNRNRELAQLGQALRIEVNGELEALKEVLQQSADGLLPGGRLVIISYHSLEDRLVKNFMRSGTFDGNVETDLFGNTNTPLKRVSAKAIKPSDEEVRRNPRSRSARMRVAERKTNEIQER